MKRKESLMDFWDHIRWTNICIVGFSEGEEKGPQKIFEERTTAENFPNMGKVTVPQVQSET